MANTDDNDRPIFVLCHGAWHPSHLYDPLKHAIGARGYEMLVPELPTMNVGTPSLTWADDAATIVRTAEPFFSKGRRVISVGHSYGGVPACAATRDNTVTERAARGEKGGFSGLVLLCAFAITERGKTVQQSNSLDGQGVDKPWQQRIKLPDGGQQLWLREEVKDVFYSDFPSEAMKQEYWDALQPQAYSAFGTPVDFIPADVTMIPKTYIICDDDTGILPEIQAHFAAASGSTAVHIAGGHNAFASRPDEVADLLVGLAEGRV